MRAASWAVAALLLLGAASPLWAGPFSEVPAGHWAYSECSRLASLGLLPSDRGANFSGNPQLTRFEFAVTVLDPLAGLDGAVAVLGGDASPTQWIEAAARGLGLSPARSESEFSEAALALLRLSDEFGDELRALSFDAVPARQALRQLADARNVQAWRVEALAPPPRALALTGAPAGGEPLRVPFARGTVALSQPTDSHFPDLLDYLAVAAADTRAGPGQAPGLAGPAARDPYVSRLRTAYEYGVGPALTLSLAYEEIARRGRGLEALDAASLASVGIGYQLTPSTSVKLSYSVLEYANYVFDSPSLRDRVAETTVSIEF